MFSFPTGASARVVNPERLVCFYFYKSFGLCLSFLFQCAMHSLTRNTPPCNRNALTTFSSSPYHNVLSPFIPRTRAILEFSLQSLGEQGFVVLSFILRKCSSRYFCYFISPASICIFSSVTRGSILSSYVLTTSTSRPFPQKVLTFERGIFCIYSWKHILSN